MGKAEFEALKKLRPLTEASRASEMRAMRAASGIEALAPVRANTKTKLEQMAPHLESLEQECLTDAKASEHLKALRTLIHNLENCPGFGEGFDLALPPSGWDPNSNA